MSNRAFLNAVDSTTWKEQNERKYGRLYTISSKAATAMGYTDALILGHLYYLQNSTPRGGHVPTTDNGVRCSFNSYEQLHQRLPFISVKTIKNRIKSMSNRLDGFTKFRANNHRSNHYHIALQLAEDLDLDCDGKTLRFHEKEALHHGILQAILLQRISYCNATLSNPMKQVQYIDPFKEYTRYSNDKRKVSRALDDLASVTGQGVDLITVDPELGYKVDTWIRDRWLEHKLNAAAPAGSNSNITLSAYQFYTPEPPKLHTELPKLHTQRVDFTLQSPASQPLMNNADSLNTSKQSSIKKSELAGSALLVKMPTASNSRMVGKKWIEFDGLTPFISQSVLHTSATRSTNPPPNTIDAPTNEATITASFTESGHPSDSLPDNELAIHEMTIADCEERFQKLYRMPIKETPISKRKTPESLFPFFMDLVSPLELFTASDNRSNFIKELGDSSEIQEQELVLITARVTDTEKLKKPEKYQNGFNPYFYSSFITHINELTSKFYLILTDIYRLPRDQHFAVQGDKDRLRADTPEHIRRYICRRMSQRGKQL